MYDNTAESRTICPYYIRSQKKSITCEGIGAAERTVLKFETEEQKKEYQKENCFRHKSMCMLQQAIDKKYK